MDVSPQDIVQAISEISRRPPILDDEGSLTFEYRGHRLGPMSPSAISEIADIINSNDEDVDGSVVAGASYEIAIQRTAVPLRLREEDLHFEDPHSGLSYTVGPPSDSYAIYLCLQLLKNTTVRQRVHIVRPNALIAERLNRGGDTSVLDWVRSALRVRTLRITAKTKLSRATWRQYANAFFFHVGYNLDVPLIPDRNMTELLRRAKISGMRRSEQGELDVPRRSYVSDLVYHYQLGLSSESPMLEYLSYYHIAEHWFENIYQDDLADQIQQTITAPDFSYKRKKDLRGLIQKISHAVQLRDEQLVINEREALRLTLEKYVDLPRLVDDLNAYDSELVGWYATHAVSFCDGNLVNFDRPDALSNLAGRIYRTRNALVHSKDGSKGKFVPFADDGALIPEIPMIRFIGEQIIVATSQVLG